MMNKLVVVAVLALCLVCVAEAKSKVAERLSQKAETENTAEQVAATTLSSGSCSCPDNSNSCDACGGSNPTYVSGGVGSSSSWKDTQQQQLANMGPRPRVEDAIRPIDEWIQDFNKRTDAQGSLWEAARATVSPLIRKLQKSQEDAMDRLRVSNKAIRDHVEEAATEHVYNLLKSKRAIDDAEVAAAAKKEQLSSAKEDLNNAKMIKGSAEAGAKEMSELLKKEQAIAEDARKKAGLPPSKDNTTSTILDHINKILGSK